MKEDCVVCKATIAEAKNKNTELVMNRIHSTLNALRKNEFIKQCNHVTAHTWHSVLMIRKTEVYQIALLALW